MRRRVRGALVSAESSRNPLFLATGAVGRYPPSEAQAMHQLLIDSGVQPDAIMLDEASIDTLASVRNCSRIIHSIKQVDTVTICTDIYHLPRTRLLFFLYGIRNRAGKMEDGRTQTGLRKWLYYCLREIPATIQDVFLSMAFH
jgi:vancomycin permeability regulator SanA